MEQLHQLLGWIALAGALAGVAWCAWVAVRPGAGPGAAPDGRLLTWFGYAVVATAIIGAITGAFRQTSGGDPGVAHPLFAALSVFAIPLARYLALLAPRRESWVWLGGYAVAAVAVLGLFQTG
jgi:hypothetical protein